MDSIQKRRSIRNYKARAVEWNLIAEVLDAGRLAPSAGNIQNSSFLVIRDLDKRKKIAEYCHEEEWIAKAPVHIIICSDSTRLRRLYGDKHGSLYAIQNSAAAIQNMLIRAKSLDLGTCWIGATKEEKLKELLKIPEEVKLFAIITLGYPKTEPRVPIKDDLNALTYFQEWGNKQRIEVGNVPLERAAKSSLHKIKSFLGSSKEKLEDAKRNITK
jgi:nitroreductase